MKDWSTNKHSHQNLDSTNNHCNMADAPDAVDTPLSLDALVRMTPEVNEQDLVQLAARHLLASHCRVQAPVKDVFFPSLKPHQLQEAIDPTWFDFEAFSVLLLCQAVGEGCDEFGFHTMINKEKVYRQLGDIYQSADWKRLGLALYCLAFVDIVKDEISKTPFSHYVISDRRRWARDLQEVVLSPEWLMQHYRPAAATPSDGSTDVTNRALNTALIKLHLLDPASVAQTFTHISRVHPQQSLDLATRNYLGGPLDTQLFMANAERAIDSATYPNRRPPRLVLADMDVYHGADVVDFILSEAKNRGLWSGKHPDNCRHVAKFTTNCSVM